MKTLLGGICAIFVCGVPAQAQVIEIDSAGAAQTFDRPTVFTGDESLPIEPPRTAVAAGASVVPSQLLAETALRHGLDPALLQAVAWQESRGRMSAVSVKGALGVMQLMPTTAAELGVDPRDIASNIRGGAIYLRRQLDRFGSVPLALAAYNAGPGAVQRYGGIPPFRETREYVTKIMGRWRPTPLVNVPRPMMIEATGL